MKDTNKNKISAVLVVQNEERRIKGCLESIRDVANEVILVHDGVCNDRTLKIAKQIIKPSKLKIYERCAWNNSESHRPYSLEKATGEWLLQIDADERLSLEIQKKLKGIISEANLKGVNQINFKWINLNTEKLNKGTPFLDYKPVLHRKSQTYHSGVLHKSFRTKGKILNLPLSLYHLDMTYLDKKFFNFKIKRRVLIDAKFRVWSNDATLPPLFYLMLVFLHPIYQFLFGIFTLKYHKKGKLGAILLFFFIVYYSCLNWTIFRIKTGKIKIKTHLPNTCGRKGDLCIFR